MINHAVNRSSRGDRVLSQPLKILEALKTTTRRAAIGVSTPVFGLRPTRSRLLRTTKVPKDESFMLSPRLSASTDLVQHQRHSLNACYASLEGRASPILICWARNSSR
jgi:hypothetical protein